MFVFGLANQQVQLFWINSNDFSIFMFERSTGCPRKFLLSTWLNSSSSQSLLRKYLILTHKCIQICCCFHKSWTLKKFKYQINISDIWIHSIFCIWLDQFYFCTKVYLSVIKVLICRSLGIFEKVSKCNKYKVYFSFLLYNIWKEKYFTGANKSHQHVVNMLVSVSQYW